jgi:hypothetical protein
MMALAQFVSKVGRWLSSYGNKPTMVSDLWVPKSMGEGSGRRRGQVKHGVSAAPVWSPM